MAEEKKKKRKQQSGRTKSHQDRNLGPARKRYRALFLIRVRGRKARRALRESLKAE